MMIRYISTITIFAGLLLSLPAHGQIKFEDLTSTVAQNYEGGVFVAKKSINTEGNPFLFDNWQKGVLIVNGQESEDLLVNYNLANNTIYISNDEYNAILEGYTVQEIKFKNQQNTVLKNGFPATGEDDLNRASFFEVIFSGNHKILKKNKVRLIRNVSSYGTATQTNSYRHYTDYYLVKDNKLEEIRLRDKDIARLFPENEDKVRDYIKDNDLDLENPMHLRKVMNYAEGLE